MTPEERRAWNRSPEGRESRRVSTRTYRERNPLAVQAWKAVERALRDGRLHKPDRCSRCGGHKDEVGRIRAHHPFHDYRRPLSVRWLCERCHKAQHRDEDVQGPY